MAKIVYTASDTDKLHWKSHHNRKSRSFVKSLVKFVTSVSCICLIIGETSDFFFFVLSFLMGCILRGDVVSTSQ